MKRARERTLGMEKCYRYAGRGIGRGKVEPGMYDH